MQCKTGTRPLVAAAILIAAAICTSATAASSRDTPNPAPFVPVEVRLFFQPGCDECAAVSNAVLPMIVAQYGDLVNVVYLSVDIGSNRAALLDAINRTGDTSNSRVYIDVGRRHLIAGAEAIERNLAAIVGMALSEPQPEQQPGSHSAPRSLAATFTLPGVIAAGLLDSINPCAFAALIFLVSVLMLARERPISILAAGLAYCLGVFATYTAIGFGLLHALRSMQGFPTVRLVFDLLMAALLLALAFLSFRDAARARAGTPGDMTLKLPDSLSAMIRSILRKRFGAAVGLGSAFLAGCIVTAIETVCTGQVYGPTLAIVVAQDGSAWREAALLLLYNLMFVLPLLVILILTWRGMTLPRLLAWSARNAFAAKIMMGLLFLAFLGFLVVTRLH